MNLDHGYHGGLYDGGYHEQDNVKGIIGTGGKSCKILNFSHRLQFNRVYCYINSFTILPLRMFTQ